MKTVKVTRNTGNFTYSGTFNISDAVEAALLEQGIVRILQSGVLGGWEKSIAYPGKGVKRPEGFTRTDIEFNDANAEALKKAVMGAEIEIGRNEKDEPVMEDLGAESVDVTVYDGPAKAEPKYARAKEQLRLYLFEPDGKTPRTLKAGGVRTAETFAASRGIAAPTAADYTEDADFLASVTAWIKEQDAAKAAME